MFRVILYGVIAFILFRIFRAVAGSVSRGSGTPPRRPASPPPRQKQEFSNVQDAEFEDITPKKPPEGGSS
jgi:hypothetical protein